TGTTRLPERRATGSPPRSNARPVAALVPATLFACPWSGRIMEPPPFCRGMGVRGEQAQTLPFSKPREKKPGCPGFFSACAPCQARGLMLTAWSPFGPAVTSKDTFWFSFRDLKPLPWIAEKWANRSLPPPSGVMNPKPLESLNHLTVPVLICTFPKKLKRRLSPGARELQGERKNGD